MLKVGLSCFAELNDRVAYDGFPYGGEPGMIGAVGKLITFRHNDFLPAADTFVESQLSVLFPILRHCSTLPFSDSRARSSPASRIQTSSPIQDLSIGRYIKKPARAWRIVLSGAQFEEKPTPFYPSCLSGFAGSNRRFVCVSQTTLPNGFFTKDYGRPSFFVPQPLSPSNPSRQGSAFHPRRWPEGP